ncbi:MAG: hypothetical protein U1E05_10115 [Patescibacteria group bacterium]|nr:hypothetical protein [Patescibacteria group bacterium]
MLSLLSLAGPTALAEPCLGTGQLMVGQLGAGGQLGTGGSELECTRCAALPCCCPDDYCRKPEPSVPCVRTSWCADDYCAKPMPCIPCVGVPKCTDDYCPKPFPSFCWPVLRQFYRCPPGSDTPARACQ